MDTKDNENLGSKDGIRRLGIMGGTFDPIHYGHLVTAEVARHKYNLEKVIFVTAGNPPHKKDKYVTDAIHRHYMTVLATITNRYFQASSVEINRKGCTHTIDTIKYFRKLYGNKYKLYFITGADAVMEILAWKDAEELVKLCDFIAATRPGYHISAINDAIENIRNNYGKVHFVEVPSLAISSTDIRNRVRTGQPIKYLLPESVESYIRKFDLYTEK